MKTRWFSVTVVLMILVLALAGCGDDDHDGGGDAGGGNYATYNGIIETIAVYGDVTNMTQKPEPPAPEHDQKGCPETLLLLVLPVYVAVKHKAFLRVCSRFIKVRVGRFGLYVGFHRDPYRFCCVSNLAQGGYRET